MNVEDTRNGVAEYVLENLGVETVELKWGQGAKCIGGEIKVDSLERAMELKRRGYIVTPDPDVPAFQAAFKAGPLKQFETPFPPWVRGSGRLHEGSRADPETRGQTRHPQDRRLPHEGTGHGHTLVQRRKNRPPDHRRRARGNGHESRGG